MEGHPLTGNTKTATSLRRGLVAVALLASLAAGSVSYVTAREQGPERLQDARSDPKDHSVVVAPILAPTGAVGSVLISGDANYALPKYGDDYLAMRLPRGTRVKICGDGGCKQMRVNDYGPVLSTGDIADISLYWFARVCGYYQSGAEDPYALARNMGECTVSVEYGGSSGIKLPPTDTEAP